jgi:tetratricopeptide (TPR) repeat protein
VPPQSRIIALLLCCPFWFAEAHQDLSSHFTSPTDARDDRGAAAQEHRNLSEDPKALFMQGEAALRNGELDAAETAFRRVLKVDPRAGGAYANLGVIAMRRKEWDQALGLLEKAAKLEPKVSGIRLNIGLVSYRRGDYASAIPAFASVLRDQPNSWQARYLLGLCDVFTEHYTDAVAALEPLWPQMSSDFMYLYVVVIAAHGAQRNDLDEKALSRLVEVGANTAEFHLIFGKAYLNRGEPEKAMAELEQAASMNPKLPFVHFNLGVARMRTQDTRGAEEEFRKDLEIEPDLPDTYELLGEYYMRMGKDDDAERFFREALRRNSRMPGSLFGLAKIYYRQDKYQQALESIDEALRFAANNQNVHFLRGRILMKMGRREEAQKELLAAAKIDNEKVERDKDLEFPGNGRVPNPELTREPQP